MSDKDKGKQPNKLEAATQSFAWAFNDPRSRAMVDALSDIVRGPSYIPNGNLSLDQVAFMEGQRHLARLILESSKHKDAI